jgi:predicted AlkP superfamily phosphohydrolase/phosphomutase
MSVARAKRAFFSSHLSLQSKIQVDTIYVESNKTVKHSAIRMSHTNRSVAIAIITSAKVQISITIATAIHPNIL